MVGNHKRKFGIIGDVLFLYHPLNDTEYVCIAYERVLAALIDRIYVKLVL